MFKISLPYLVGGLCLWQSAIVRPDKNPSASNRTVTDSPPAASRPYLVPVAAFPMGPVPTQMVYIYGYNNSLVMAEVVNANQNQVAYTSFESIDKGFWTYNGAAAGSATDKGRTGIRYYNLSAGTIQRTGLQKGKYIVSYWANGSATLSGTNYTLLNQTNGTVINGWTYYQSILSLSADNSSITLSGSVKVDEVRLYPFEAQMSTYTYDTLIGKTSETDANNATIYYEYDEFNRLKCIKDQSGNIRQSYVYHIKNQQ